jgi:hypothetical protein
MHFVRGSSQTFAPIMISAESLISGIRREFSKVPFPSHCGLHAAIAIDDWVEDEQVLAEITRREDFIGDWWDVPIAHLRSCMMALSYLDAGGMTFYLPAYMTALVERPEEFDNRTQTSSGQIVFAMLPDRQDPELEQYFLSRFSSIDRERKRVCREFLIYVSGNAAYDEHAKALAMEALAHDFWSSPS